MPTNNNIPNQNNLFDIFKSQVDTISALDEVLIKAKINQKTGKRIAEASKVILDASKAIYDALMEVSKGNEGQFGAASKTFNAASVALNNVFVVLDKLGTMKFGSVLVARIRIHRLYRVTWELMKFMWRVGLVNPTVFTVGGLVIKSMSENITKLVDMTQELGRVKLLFLVRRSLKRLYKVLFGHYPRTPRKPGDIGIYDIYKRLSHARSLQTMVKGSLTIKLMAGVLRDLTKAVNILGISLPLIAMSWLSVKILDPVTRGLARIFRRMGRRRRAIIFGSFALNFMAGALLTFIGTMILVGLGAVLGAKYIGVAVLVVTGIVGLLILIGLARPLIKRGKRAIRDITLAVAMLAFTALGITLLGAFFVSNTAGFVQFGLYLVVLVGVFFALTFATKFIKKGAKNILMIVACVALLALIAIGMVLVGQLIDANMEAILTIGAALIALVLAVIAVGKLEKHIMKGMPAMVMLATIAGIMAGVMIGIAVAAAIGDPLEMLEVVGIMALIIVAVGAIALAAGTLIAGPQAVVFALGLVAVGMISGLCAAIAGVGILIAAAANAIKSTGYTDAQELAEVLNLPFAAIIRGDKDGESLFDILGDLPGVLTMLKLTAKVVMLSQVASSIGSIADVLQHIASLNMPDPLKGYDDKGNPKGWKQMTANDFAAASQNASVILGMCSAMFADEPTDFVLADGTKFTTQVVNTAALDNIGFMTKYKVRRLADIVGSVGQMADVLQHISSLNMPDPDKGYDENGKPKGWKQMTTEDFTMASQNAGSILTYFASLFADEKVPVQVLGKTIMVGAPNQMMAGLDNVSRSMRRKVTRLGEIVASVGGMAVTLQNVASLNVPDPDKGYDEHGKPKGWLPMGPEHFTAAGENVNKIATCLIEAVASPDLAHMLEEMDDDAAENFQAIMTPMNSIGAVVEMISKLGGGEYVSKWKDDPDNPGQRIPAAYESFTDLLKKSGTIRSNLIAALSIVIGAVSVFETDEYYEEMLDQAEDAIDDLVEVCDGARSPIETVMSIYTTYLKDTSMAEITKAYTGWGRLLEVVISDIALLDMHYDLSDMEDCADSIDEIVDVMKSPIKTLLKIYNDNVNTKIDGIESFYTAVITYPISALANFEPEEMMDVQKGALPVFKSIAASMSTVKIDDKQAKNYQTNVKETIELLKQVNRVDLNKLKTFDSTMKHIANLSKSIRGDFQGLAKAINEDLLDALKKLVDVLENPPSRPAEQGSSILATAAPTNNKAQQMDPKKMNQAKEAQAREDIKELTKKIDKLAGVLQSAMTTSKGNTAVRVTEK